MAFEWGKYYKSEEWYEQQITDNVFERIAENYGVDADSLEQLTKEQYLEVKAWFEDELNEYSLLQTGWLNFRNMWQNENDDFDD